LRTSSVFDRPVWYLISGRNSARRLFWPLFLKSCLFAFLSPRLFPPPPLRAVGSPDIRSVSPSLFRTLSVGGLSSPSSFDSKRFSGLFAFGHLSGAGGLLLSILGISPAFHLLFDKPLLIRPAFLCRPGLKLWLLGLPFWLRPFDRMDVFPPRCLFHLLPLSCDVSWSGEMCFSIPVSPLFKFFRRDPLDYRS